VREMTRQMGSEPTMGRLRRADPSSKTGGEAVANVELTSENWENVVAGGGLVLVSFRADWCSRCTVFGPVFERASGRHTDIVFGKVNIEDEKDLAARFGVCDVPTLMVVSDGTVCYSKSGALLEQDLEELICSAREGRLDAAMLVPPRGRETPALTAAPGDGDPAATLRNGLRASYLMDEGSDSLIADRAGGHPLTLTGGWWGGGLLRRRVVFSGFSAAATTPCFLDTGKAFSVSAWVWLADNCGWHTVISQDGTEVSGFYLQYSAVHDAWAFSMLSGDSVKAGPAWAADSLAPCVGQWQHLAGVHDTEADQLRLYVDGRRAATADFSRVWSATGSFVVGRGLFGGAADWFSGLIDGIRAWDRALSDTEALALAESGRDGAAR